MLRRCRRWPALTLLAGALLLTGCADPLIVDDPTGVVFVDRLLAFLANPNVAYLLLVLGLLAIIAEVATPGAVGPGVIGSLMLLMSLFGLLQLPTNWLGVLLILSGVIMMLIDIKVPGFILSIGGIVAFLIGSLLLFARPAETPLSAIPVSPLNPLLALGTTAAVGAFFLLGVAAAFRAHQLPVATGKETLLGKVGVARQPLEPVGIVHIEGEEWSAENVTGEYIPAGARVRVIGLDGLRLKVEVAPDH